MFAAGHQPRSHLTLAAKAIGAAAVLARLRGPQGDDAPAPRAALPLVNRFGRPYLPISPGVPLPVNAKIAIARPWKYLQIGDSFFEPCNGASMATLIQRIKWDAKAYRPARFDLVEMTQEGKPGLRVWRVA